MRTSLSLVLLPLAVAACAGPTMQTAAPPQTSPEFGQALAAEYRDLARSERVQSDWRDADRFRTKAEAATRGSFPAPDDPRNRRIGTGINLHPSLDIGREQRAEALAAHGRLAAMLQGDAPRRNPVAAARAQVAYDCWIEQLEEGWQRDDIERCRQAFRTAMAEAEARPVAAAPAPAPAVETDRLQVFFEFDSADPREAGRRIAATAAEEIRRANPERVTIIGHTDTVGSDAYNDRLSARRAQALARELAARGVPADRVETVARGQRDPLVPTGDGVRELQNRRAVIEYD